VSDVSGVSGVSGVSVSVPLGQDVVVGGGLTLRYGSELGALPPALAARFHPAGYDDEAKAFVERSLAAPHGGLRTWLYGLLRRSLSDYDAYGLLSMYPMHLWSVAQARSLLAAAGGALGGRLLDVGAGGGGITAQLARDFATVLVTESSPVLGRQLARRGYTVLALDLGTQPVPSERAADVVTCLNVLDRTAYPRSMLAHLRDGLRPGGVLVLSLPLPLRPHVQRAGQTADPEERLPAAEASFEAGLTRVEAELLTPAGLSLRAWSRMPYLCHGDAHSALHVLDAAVLACARADG
jgi:SAM-dependent methyltransferase